MEDRLGPFWPGRNCKKLQIDACEFAIIGAPPGAGSLPQWIAPNGYQWFVSQLMLTVVVLLVVLVAVIQLGGPVGAGVNKR